MADPHLCDRCQRNMTDPDTGTTIFGCQLSRPANVVPELDAAFQRIYPKIPVTFTVTICWECWLEVFLPNRPLNL